MLSEVEIEALSKEEDLEGIANIEREVFGDLAWSWRMLKSEWKNPHSRIIVLKKADEVIGYLIFRYCFDEAEVLRLAISPSYQGRGLGRSLLQSSLSVLKEMGIREVYLEVSDKNERAIKLYKGLGFRQIGKRSGYYNGGDALLFNLKLGGRS